MKIALLAMTLAILAGSSALAEIRESKSEPLRYQITFNPEVRYERSADQQMVFRQPLNLAVGFRKDKFTYLFEVSQFQETSGNSTLSIDRSHREYVGWLNYSVLPIGQWNVFAAFGVGAYQENIRTSLYGSSVTDTGEMQLVGGAGAGLKVLIARHLLLSFEGRFIGAQNFDPNPQGALVIRIGAEF